MNLSTLIEQVSAGDFHDASSLDLPQTVTIRIEGKAFNGKVNYNVANLIVELQNIVSSFEQLKDFTDDLEIEAEVSKGCSLINIDFGKLFKVAKTVLSKMDGKQILGALGVVAVVYVLTHGMSVYKEFAETSSNNETARAAIEVVDDVASKALTSISKFADRAKEFDSISVNDRTYSRKEFMQAYQPKDESALTEPEIQRFCIDGTYGYDMISAENKKLSIKLDKARMAKIGALSGAQVKGLMQKQLEAVGVTKYPEEQFQVTVMLLAGAVKGISIDGIGTPRSGCVTLEEARQTSIEREEGV